MSRGEGSAGGAYLRRRHVLDGARGHVVEVIVEAVRSGRIRLPSRHCLVFLALRDGDRGRAVIHYSSAGVQMSTRTMLATTMPMYCAGSLPARIAKEKRTVVCLRSYDLRNSYGGAKGGAVGLITKMAAHGRSDLLQLGVWCSAVQVWGCQYHAGVMSLGEMRMCLVSR